MTSDVDRPIDASMVVRGKSGEVVRVASANRRMAFPVADNIGSVVDVWVLPGGMHMACLRGSIEPSVVGFGFVLAYVDNNVRDLARTLGLHQSLAVDVWHVQRVNVSASETEARTMMRHIAHAAADGAIPFSPIRREDRARWQVAVDTMAALATRTPRPVV